MVKKEGSTSYVKTYEKQTLRTDPEQTQLLKSRLRADTNQTRGQLLRFALVLGCVRSVLFFQVPSAYSFVFNGSNILKRSYITSQSSYKMKW